MLGRAGLFLGDGVDDVSFDVINRGGSKPVEDLVLHLAGQLSAHLIDRPPQATPQCHDPEILWRAQCLVPIFRSDIDTLGATVVEERVGVAVVGAHHEGPARDPHHVRVMGKTRGRRG